MIRSYVEMSIPVDDIDDIALINIKMILCTLFYLHLAPDARCTVQYKEQGTRNKLDWTELN